jgi:uncharacterized cupredoxin-like copper-binding protein
MPPLTARAAATVLVLASMLVPVGGASAEAVKPTVINVQLSEFSFAPAHIDLNHGQAYVLRVTNAGKHAHDLSAKAFFQTVALSSAASAMTDDGDIGVAEGQTVDVELTPTTPGTYEMHCTHPMHSMLGMRGQFVVH